MVNNCALKRRLCQWCPLFPEVFTYFSILHFNLEVALVLSEVLYNDETSYGQHQMFMGCSSKGRRCHILAKVIKISWLVVADQRTLTPRLDTLMLKKMRIYD